MATPVSATDVTTRDGIDPSNAETSQLSGPTLRQMTTGQLSLRSAVPAAAIARSSHRVPVPESPLRSSADVATASTSEFMLTTSRSHQPVPGQATAAAARKPLRPLSPTQRQVNRDSMLWHHTATASALGQIAQGRARASAELKKPDRCQ